MKKILSLILAALLLCSALAACSPADANNPDGTNNSGNTISTEELAKELESTISVTTNNYQINNALITYMFNNIYQSFVSYYSSALNSIGLDTTKSLKEQYYGETTWFDYFMEYTLSELEPTILFAELALKNDITLNDEDYEAIDSYIDSYLSNFEAIATEDGTTKEAVMEQYFGKGVTIETVRKFYEIQELSYKAYTSFIDSLSFEDADIDNYFNENPAEFLYVSYYSVPLTVTIPEDASEDEVKALKDELTAAKDSLIAAKTTEEFKAACTDYLKKKYEGNDAKTDLVISQEVESTFVEDIPLSQLYSLGFAKDAEFAEGLNMAVEGTNKYTVYFVTCTPARAEYSLRNVRHIMLSPSSYDTDEAARNKAAEILSEYLNGEQTAEAFGKLAEKYSDDSSSNTNGGLYENVDKNDFNDASFNEWIYDPARVEGDTGIVSTSSGYHVMYYAGETSPKWQLEVETALMNNAYDQKIKDLKEEFSYTINKDNINKINV